MKKEGTKMTYNGQSMKELYWAIEDALYEMEQVIDFDVINEDPVYQHLCDLLNRYDAGDRTIDLFNEMRGAYAYAS